MEKCLVHGERDWKAGPFTDKRGGNAPETASDLCAAIEALSTSGCAYESGGHRHIDWLVTYYYDASEVATHIRTRLKVPARG